MTQWVYAFRARLLYRLFPVDFNIMHKAGYKLGRADLWAEFYGEDDGEA
jgi:hypothetical protein